MTLFNFAINNIKRNKKSYIYYFINCSIAVFIFFLFSVLSFHPSLKVIDSNSTMGTILIFGELIALLFALGFISYSVICYLKARSKQLGTLSILGATKKQINKLLFIENFVIGCLAIVNGILLGLIFSKVFLDIASKIIGSIRLNFYFPLASILASTIIFLIVFLIISFLIPKFIIKEKVIVLLKKEDYIEKSPNMLSLFIIFFASLAITGFLKFSDSSIFDSTLVNLIFLAVLLLLLVSATALFIALIQKIAIVILKNTGVYYKYVNMIKYSKIASSMKSNIGRMTFIALLYTISLSSIMLLSSMSDNAADEANKITPFALSYLSWDETIDDDKNISIIRNELLDKKDLKEIDFVAYDKNRDYIVSQSDYNNIMDILNRKKIKLDKPEIYLVSGGSSKLVDSIPNEIKIFLDRHISNISIKGKTRENILLDGLSSSITVVNDELIKELDGDFQVRKIFAFDYSDWKDDKKTYSDLEKIFKKEKNNADISLISKYSYYESNKLQNNLLLYIGSMLSFVFFSAVSSLIYSRLYTNIAKDCKKYKKIVKLGLSKKDLKNLLTSPIKVMLVLPFIISIIYMWIFTFLLEKNMAITNIPMAFRCTIIYTLAQIIYYYAIKTTYIRKIMTYIEKKEEVF